MATVQAAVNDPSREDQIRSLPCPTCYLCGTEGEPLYEGLRDSLFGAPGAWNFSRCPNRMCGLIWLDPIPSEEDIGKAYATYYTHHNENEHDFGLKSRTRLKSSLIAVYSLLLRATRIRRARKQIASMYLGETAAAKLLEVGCGDGNRLARLRALGWDVQGQEVDPEAAAHARLTHGINVHLGHLEELEFPDAVFDAVIMHHVIEHVHDPARLLKECKRVLRVGGALVVVTPNAESYGHELFGSHWRGLEPPRHLKLFSQRTIRQVAARAGFSRFETWTSPAHAEDFARGSLSTGVRPQITSVSRLARGFWAASYQIGMIFLYLVNKNSGDECVLRAAK
jgi:SAM-dependent methyltransferase